MADLDRHLVQMLSLSVEPVQLLQDIEQGSLRTWIATQLRRIDDEALQSGDWKRIAGDFLVRGKYAVIRFMEANPEVSRPEGLVSLEEELMAMTEPVEAMGLPPAHPIPRKALLSDLKGLGDAGAQLGSEDRAAYIGPSGTIPIDTRFRLTTGDVERLLTSEIIPARQELTLLVKRPDYLGTAQWEFRLEDHVIKAKILDEDWLDEFQKRSVEVRPGDSLKARVNAELLRDERGREVAVRYLIVRVLEVIPGEPDDSQLLLPPFLGDVGEAG
jgi:hypothetical protein